MCPHEGQRIKKFCDSNGLVEDFEILVRVVKPKLHYNKKSGNLKPGALPISHLKKLDKGLSVDRQTLHTKESYRAKLNEKLGRKEVEAVMRTTAGQVREIGNSAFLICPSGSEDDPAHADILLRNVNEDDGLLEFLRLALLDLFKPEEDLNSFFAHI